MMSVAAWWVAGGAVAFGGLAVHPFVTYPLSLMLARSFLARKSGKHERLAPGPAPSRFSIVFCAHNEQDVLPAKLANLLDVRQQCPERVIEILVYDDCSSDRTLEILREREPEIVVVHGEVRSGKSVGMNRLLERATGEIVLFTDANVMLSVQSVGAFADAFRDPQVGVACSHLIYTNSETATASVGTAYWRLEERIKQLESDTGSTMGADGSGFAIRRELFSPAPGDVDDDFHTSMSILTRGHRIVSCPQAHVYEKSVTQSAQEIGRKVRIACRALNCHRRLRPGLRRLSPWNRYKYFSHKWLRWFTALWLFLACALGTLGIGLQWGWMAGVGSAALLVLGLCCLKWLKALGVPFLGKVWEILLAFGATFYGVICSLRGERFETWTPASSARE